MRPKRPKWVIISESKTDRFSIIPYLMHTVCLQDEWGKIGKPVFSTVDDTLAQEVRKWYQKNEPPQCPHWETGTIVSYSLGGYTREIRVCNTCHATLSNAPDTRSITVYSDGSSSSW